MGRLNTAYTKGKPIFSDKIYTKLRDGLSAYVYRAFLLIANEYNKDAKRQLTPYNYGEDCNIFVDDGSGNKINY